MVVLAGLARPVVSFVLAAGVLICHAAWLHPIPPAFPCGWCHLGVRLWTSVPSVCVPCVPVEAVEGRHERPAGARGWIVEEGRLGGGRRSFGCQISHPETCFCFFHTQAVARRQREVGLSQCTIDEKLPSSHVRWSRFGPKPCATL
ncbi:hypothetical protein BDP55DRAFT_681943 [Colletotrichum godetiae]|uniref:Uncharacterized protein n=1 Tax=Colletotrichum godetiae TaxID=1209918 RepID=A0AAJ0ERN7_9PEZI|nr:uncharacterized protein BDP55DRAFT_681943 [Colletotrichum godetiae]KAK1658714.1 hypothetical protein BDP55DRAFT_681943 [Colletotrichum godetiae]